MRQLSIQEIEQVLRKNPVAKKIAVENFLAHNRSSIWF